jgi:hypothetical protein
MLCLLYYLSLSSSYLSLRMEEDVNECVATIVIYYVVSAVCEEGRKDDIIW